MNIDLELNNIPNGKIMYGLVGIEEVKNENGGDINDLSHFDIVEIDYNGDPRSYQINIEYNGTVHDSNQQEITTVTYWGNFYKVKWWIDMDNPYENSECASIVLKYMNDFNLAHPDYTPLEVNQVMSDIPFE